MSIAELWRIYSWWFRGWLNGFNFRLGSAFGAVLLANKPNLVVTIEDFTGTIVPGRINYISAKILTKSISLKRRHQSFIVSLNFPLVGPAAVHHHVSAKGLNIRQAHVIGRWSGCVFLVLERDEEAHDAIIFR